MIQWQWARWVSFGIHIETSRLYTGQGKIPYGPYLDLHIFNFIFSIGYHPYNSLAGSDNIPGVEKK